MFTNAYLEAMTAETAAAGSSAARTTAAETVRPGTQWDDDSILRCTVTGRTAKFIRHNKRPTMIKRGRTRMRRIRRHNVNRTQGGHVTVGHVQIVAHRRHRINPTNRQHTSNVNGNRNFHAVQFHRSRHFSHVHQATQVERNGNRDTINRIPNASLLRMDIDVRATHRSRMTRLNRRVRHQYRQILRTRGISRLQFNR